MCEPVFQYILANFFFAYIRFCYDSLMCKFIYILIDLQQKMDEKIYSFSYWLALTLITYKVIIFSNHEMNKYEEKSEKKISCFSFYEDI